MNVLEHMKNKGYDVSRAMMVRGSGSMECSRIDVFCRTCFPQRDVRALMVQATAYVLFTDGCEHPYPFGWPRADDAIVTAYFRI